MEVRTSGGDLDSTTLTNHHYGGHPKKNPVSTDIIRTSLKPPPPFMDIVRRNGFFLGMLSFNIYRGSRLTEADRGEAGTL